MAVILCDVMERLRAAREARGWSQQDLADETRKLGRTYHAVSLRTISRLETVKHADPRLSVLRSLAKALGVSPSDLLD